MMDPWRTQLPNQAAVAAVEENSNYKQKSFGTKRPAPSEHSEATAGKDRQCRYCGGRRHENKKACAAFGKECREFGRKNHFASVCERKGSRQKSVNEVSEGGTKLVKNSAKRKREVRKISFD